MYSADSGAMDLTDTTLDRRDWIAGIEKGLRMLEVFDGTHSRLTASEAGKLTDMTRTAARRHLLTLAHLGYVGTDGKLFWLTPRVLRLGQAYLDSSRLARIVQPFLQRITAGTHEAAYVSVMDGDDVVYIARSGANRAMNTGFVLGARMPAQVTASGLMLLAQRDEDAIGRWLDSRSLTAFTSYTIASKERLQVELLRVRQQGYALSEQQIDLYYRGVAVALRNSKGEVVGAVNVTMPIGHETAEDAIRRTLPVLRETVQAMRGML